ncbi:hypothetical protein EXU57_05515 [Segetibacter sp. 3557_3]|uniref:hypothetical protein n=1 Tax=Segetibacter sp. 3557_3 TaxID=2547429 RepID=UPI001058905A|nr:hypothetical protein [Segetibacter sp. 3557_3]TDH27925.1 hypothetical protein EXU57_05515 [Segetibacter sp. 3557_3]
MFITKHHYAVELSKLGNKVYFLNPPEGDVWSWKKPADRIKITRNETYPNLYLVQHELFFPYLLKFHARWLYDLLVRKHLAQIESIIGEKLDIVWSFDHSNISPLEHFRNAYKIFHPVDDSVHPHSFKAVKSADILFTVTKEILKKYSNFKLPKHLINHGVAEVFLDDSNARKNNSGVVHVGLSGNWLRPDLDHPCIIRIIRENPRVIFNFFGSYNISETNLGGGHRAHSHFIRALQGSKNVILHGPLPYESLAGWLHKMDLFLICYDVVKDQSNGTNYHKIMEYLSTGKVIVSNNISSYSASPELIQMVAERNSNDRLPALFKKVVSNIAFYNSAEFAEKRKAVARNNTYLMQIRRIESIVYPTSKVEQVIIGTPVAPNALAC